MAAVQISQLQIHPQLPILWTQLGRSFELLGKDEVSKSCHEQSQKLYDASEKSLPESFVKEANKANRQSEGLEDPVEVITDEKGNDDFTDLGSSKLRSLKEAEIATRGQKMKADKSVSQHPPLWLEDQDEGEQVHKFIQRFIDARK